MWCWCSQGSLSCNSSSNKNQSTSSSSNTLSCAPSTKGGACLFLLQIPIRTQEKTIVPLQEGRDVCGQRALWKNPSQRVLHHLKYTTDTSLFTFWGVPAGRHTLDCSLAPLYQSPLSWGRCKIMCLVMPKTHGGVYGGADGVWELSPWGIPPASRVRAVWGSLAGWSGFGERGTMLD